MIIEMLRLCDALNRSENDNFLRDFYLGLLVTAMPHVHNNVGR